MNAFARRLERLGRRLMRGLVLAALLLGAVTAQAAVAYVNQSTSSLASNAVSSLAITAPSGMASGNLMVAFIAQNGGCYPMIGGSSGNCNSTGSAPTGWTQLLNTNNNNDLATVVYYKFAAAGDLSSSFTWSFSGGGRAAGAIMAFSGVDTTTPFAASGGKSNTSSTTMTTASITTASTTTMLLAMFGSGNGNNSIAAPSGMTEIVDASTAAGSNGVGIEAAYVTPGTSLSGVSKQATSSANAPNIGILVALAPASSSSVDHYELWVPTSSLACLSSTVNVRACSTSASGSSCSLASTVSGNATLSTSAGSLGTTTVSLTAGAGSTTLSYAGASNGATAAVTLASGPTSTTSSTKCCLDGTSCSTSGSCSTTFNTAGFIVAAAANGISATLPTQTSGTASSTYYLRAVQTNTTTKACEGALSGANTVNWAYECDNPATCSASNLMSIDGGTPTTIQRNNNAGVSAYTPLPMTFDANGNAPFAITFSDVGQTTLWATKTVNSATLAGSSNSFVTKPAGFTVSAVAQTASPNLANPAAASASGARFVKAGESFGATVTAVTSGGAATPNYGKEASPEGVVLTRALVLPSGGSSGTLSNGTIAGGSFGSGAATVTNLAFSEVGIITLTASVADGDYLGAGNVTGTTSGNIGRFVPAQFALSAAATTHRASLSCSPASTFTYLGENFRFGFTLTAQNTAGTTTQNYTGSFAKLDPTLATGFNLAGRDATTVFTTAGGRLSLGSATGSWSNGMAGGITLVANAGRAGTPDGPFSAGFGIAPLDSDGVAMGSFDMASVSGGSNDRAAVGTIALRFGRLRLSNAVGSQARSLSLPLVAQSWTGSAFDTNALDSCTTVPAAAVSFGNLRKTLTVADTNVSGSSVALAAGIGRLTLLAPTAGRNGSADVALSLGSSAVDASCLQAWTPGIGDAATVGANLAFLRGAWCGSTYDKDPSARATWGLYRGADAVLYQRENY